MAESLIDLRSTQEYQKLGYQIVICPVCGNETLDGYWICQHCGWEYDDTTDENIYSSCNKATITEYRKHHT